MQCTCHFSLTVHKEMQREKYHNKYITITRSFLLSNLNISISCQCNQSYAKFYLQQTLKKRIEYGNTSAGASERAPTVDRFAPSECEAMHQLRLSSRSFRQQSVNNFWLCSKHTCVCVCVTEELQCCCCYQVPTYPKKISKHSNRQHR